MKWIYSYVLASTNTLSHQKPSLAANLLFVKSSAHLPLPNLNEIYYQILLEHLFFWQVTIIMHLLNWVLSYKWRTNRSLKETERHWKVAELKINFWNTPKTSPLTTFLSGPLNRPPPPSPKCSSYFSVTYSQLLNTKKPTFCIYFFWNKRSIRLLLE